MHYVGIDVGSKFHVAAIIPEELMAQANGAWKKARTLKVHNNAADYAALLTALPPPDQVQIAIDHTGGHYSAALVAFLQTFNYAPFFLEAKAIKAAKERFLDVADKSDQLDAACMARLLYARQVLQDPLRISPIAPHVGTGAAILKMLALQHHALTTQATRATNRLRQLYKAVFPEAEAAHFSTLADLAIHYPTPQDLLAADLSAWRLAKAKVAALQKLAATTVGVSPEGYREAILHNARARYAAQAEADQLLALVKGQLADHPDAHILASFPYCGPIASALLLGTYVDVARFPSRKAWAKALGVYTVSAQSGQSGPSPRRAKEGSADVRRALGQIALLSIRESATKGQRYNRYYRRLRARGKIHWVALVATMREYADHLYAALKHRQLYKEEP